MAVEEPSFKISTDATSSWFRSLMFPLKGIPSTTIRGLLLAPNDLEPLIKILGAAPGLLLPPLRWISIPAPWPWMADARLEDGISLMDCSLMDTIEPVTSDLRRVPYPTTITLSISSLSEVREMPRSA